MNEKDVLELIKKTKEKVKVMESELELRFGAQYCDCKRIVGEYKMKNIKAPYEEELFIERYEELQDSLDIMVKVGNKLVWEAYSDKYWLRILDLDTRKAVLEGKRKERIQQL